MEHKHANHLIDETSPYLLQHAHNPVDWHPWDEQALQLARQQDKPILLSIGYSACHWCHVMEHESFEDEQTAEYMNKHFVCVKVDREERPDLDKIYQLAHQMLTQRAGGWPLNVVIAPDTHAPFFAGTYFPKSARHGMPSFTEVLHRVNDYYHGHRGELEQHTAAIKEAFMRTEPAGESEVDAGVLDAAVKQLLDNYDPVYGGFGHAPKFPHPTNIDLCLRHWGHARTQPGTNPRPLHVARHTLRSMAEGGLYDQLGGGFFRYSVDSQWSVPHFEKMLYDNAQLLPLYVDAWLATKDDFFKDIARTTARWVIADMQSASGGYYSTLDADSEGEEGKFYAWSLDELKEALSEEYAVVEVRFGLRGTPNFEGKWHLNVHAPMDTVAERCGISIDEARSLLTGARQKLLAVRANRIKPGRDEKILTSWNALMIKGMAHAGFIMGIEEFVLSASKALDYVRRNLWSEDRLLATAKDKKAHLNAYLDDYVFLIDAIIELNQARWRSEEIRFAARIADIVIERFEDQDSGGLFFTSSDHEKLLHRSKPASDDAIPSGNGIAAKALLRLGHLLGEHRYLRTAERILRLFSPTVGQYPAAHGALITAMEEFLYPPDIVVVRGDPVLTREWTQPLSCEYAPRTMLFNIPNGENDLPGILDRLKAEEQVTAYICRGTSCSAPISDKQVFINTMNESKQHV